MEMPEKTARIWAREIVGQAHLISIRYKEETFNEVGLDAVEEYIKKIRAEVFEVVEKKFEEMAQMHIESRKKLSPSMQELGKIRAEECLGAAKVVRILAHRIGEED